MQKIELLPKGGFVLHGEKEAYKGRFSMYALDRFCTETGVENYFALIEKISSGMSLKNYAELLRCALNDTERGNEKYAIDTVFDLFDELFDGVEDANFIALLYHAIGRISTPDSVKHATGEPDSEKKRKH
jgi:hypothetical protein